MSKSILFSDEARAKVAAGVTKLARAVKITLGPCGRNVLLERPYGAPAIVNDGVTIARDIDLADRFERMGAELVKEVASKTNDIAGDGTTTATVLAEAIVTEGLKNLAAGANPMALKTGIQKAAQLVAEELKKNAEKCEGPMVEDVATISAQDSDIGKKIAEAVAAIKGGPITTEDSRTSETSLEIKEGMEFKQGFISPYLVTDQTKMEAVLEDVAVILTDRKVTDGKEHLVTILETAWKWKGGKCPVLLIAENVEGDALPILIVNKLNGAVSCVAVKAPGFGDQRTANLEDLAVVTGATVISESVGIDFKSALPEHIGSASKVVVTKDSTTIAGGGGSKEKIAERVTQLQAELEKATGEYDKERLSTRIAKLTDGVAVIKVGAATETELKDKKLRIEDAINATRAAMEEGIVAGGGYALLVARDVLKDWKGESDDETTGGQIVYRALSAPAAQIATNAGKDGAVVVAESLRTKMGYNAATDSYEDLVAAKVIDPAKVTVSALTNAASVASLLLTTEAAVSEIPKEEKSPDPS